MARSVPSQISNALGSTSQTPTLSCTLADAFDRPYSSIANNNAGRSAIIQLPTGKYVRAYVNQPGLGSNAQVYSQLVADPTNPSQLNTYNLRTSSAAGQAGVALALFGSTIFLFYSRSSDNHICYQTSTDGLGWSAETVALNTTSHVWALASSGNNDLFYAVNASSDAAQNIVYAAYSSGSFSVAGTDSATAAQVSGLAVVYQAGAYRIAAGTQSRANGALALCSLTYNPGSNTWSTLAPIHPIDDTTVGLSAPYPGLAFINGLYRLTSVLYDSGAASGSAAQKTEMWASPDFVHWFMEQLIPGPFTNGCNVAPGPQGGWLAADAGTLTVSTAAVGATFPTLDVSGDVRSIHIHEPANDAASGKIVLANQAGQNTPGNPPNSSIRVGAKITLGHGYGSTTVTTHTLYVDRIDQFNDKASSASPDYDAGETRYDPHTSEAVTPHHEDARVVLHVSNRARLLKRTTTHDKTIAGANLLYLVTEAATAAGLLNTPSSPNTAQFSQTVDSFAFSTAHSFEEHFKRLAQLYGFDWFLDENETLQLREPQANDASSFTYGTGHVQPIGHTLAPQKRPNSVRVAGYARAGSPPPFSDAQDYSAVGSHGEVRHDHIADRLLSSASQCAIRAGLEIRKGQRAAQTGALTLPLNPTHQPLDVITISDETLSTTNRITALDWLTDLQNGAFNHIATIEAP